jgi:hypothetical protein
MVDFEKTPLASKKFIAFFFTIMVVAGLLAVAFFTQTIGWPLAAFSLAGVLVIGFIGVGYVLSTAQLDKFVRMAQITAKLPSGDDNAGDDTED